MNVDTGELRALTEQTAALGRKVSTLTGRVTVMGNHLNRLDAGLDEDLRTMIRAMVRLIEASGLMPAEPSRPAPPRPRGHLRVVKDGEQ